MIRIQTPSNSPLLRRRIRIIFVAVFLLPFLLPPAALAAECCKCTAPNDPNKIICIKTETPNVDCNTLTINTGNEDIKKLNCTSMPESAQCQKINKGVCDEEPTTETSYKEKSAAQPAAAEPTAARRQEIPPPKLGVDIPFLKFSPAVASEALLSVPWLAQYISAIQNWLLGISMVAAAIMLVYGGFLYIVGSTGIKISSGKEIMINAVIGLILVFGAYTILSTINPATLKPAAMELKLIRPLEDSYLAVYGGGEPISSTEVEERAEREGTPGTPSVSEPTQVGDPVSIDDIPFDKSLGGPANMNLYCTTKADAAKATTYEQKIQLLVKAVMGWHKVCVKEKLCVYCQGCYTAIPGGSISSNPATNYVVNQLQGEISMESLFLTREYHPECVEAYRKNPSSTNGMAACRTLAKKAYDEIFVSKFSENKLFAGDCGSFSFRFYESCVNAARKMPPGEKVWHPIKKKYVQTPYLTEKSLGKFDDDPTFVLGSHLDADLNALAAKKGGLKFGDLVYTQGGSGSYASHWIMYTGGRTDFRFSFIEMGGEGSIGPNIPGLGQKAGVKVHPPGMTLQDYVNLKIKPQPGYWKNTVRPPSYDAKKSIIFVWRPYAD